MREASLARHVRLAAALLVPALALTFSLTAQPPDLDQTVERVRKEFNVPGVAIAIVKDGKLAFARGYGVRKLGEAAPVDENTLFGIASNSKAFTAVCLAMLVDEGKLNWNDTVIQHYPAFQMHDLYATHHMTIRDLVSHRSGLGLGAGDLLFFPRSNLSSEEILLRLRRIPPNKSFRDRFDYSNLMFLVAGKVVENVSGKPWMAFVRERIFAPLGMNTSAAGVRELKPGVNLALPHAEDSGVLRTITPTDFDNCAPAGSINSSVAEMAPWLITQLNQGVSAQGTRLFSERQSREMWSAVTPLPVFDPPEQMAAARSNFSAYGLGWFLRDYRGHKLVSHGGGLTGMVTQVTLIPGRKLGVVVLTNAEEGAVLGALTNSILDHYLAANDTDWVMAYAHQRSRTRADAQAAVAKAAASRNAASKPSLPLAQYEGVYRDAWYGDVLITLQGDRLSMQFASTPQLEGDLEHFQYDTFIARWKDRSLNADAYVTFSLTAEGGIGKIAMQAVSPLTDFSFDFHDLNLRPVPAKPPAR